MARLQDFQTVTPSATNDKLLIVQATGQGNATIKAVGDAIFGAETSSDLPFGTGTPTSGSTGAEIAKKVNTSDIDTSLNTSSGHPIANSAVASAFGKTINQANLSAGNKTIGDLQSWCKTASSGAYWGMAYMTAPYTGWALYLIINKIVSTGHAEILLFYNEHHISSFTSNLSATTPSWTTKNVTLT